MLWGRGREKPQVMPRCWGRGGAVRGKPEGKAGMSRLDLLPLLCEAAQGTPRRATGLGSQKARTPDVDLGVIRTQEETETQTLREDKRIEGRTVRTQEGATGTEERPDSEGNR